MEKKTSINVAILPRICLLLLWGFINTEDVRLSSWIIAQEIAALSSYSTHKHLFISTTGAPVIHLGEYFTSNKVWSRTNSQKQEAAGTAPPPPCQWNTDHTVKNTEPNAVRTCWAGTSWREAPASWLSSRWVCSACGNESHLPAGQHLQCLQSCFAHFWGKQEGKYHQQINE